MSHFPRLRRDVVRHRTALLDAAARVFAEHGVHVPLEAVAEAADMARATLYRHFPDRNALLLALFDRDIAPILSAGEGRPSGEVLFAMIEELGRAARRATALADAWRAIAPDNPEMLARQRDLMERLEKPLADAISAGRVRSDLTLWDVVRIIRMVAVANHPEYGDDERSGERIMDLVLNGIAARQMDEGA